MPYFLKVIELSPPSHAEANYEQGDTGRAGVWRRCWLLPASSPRAGTVTVVNEWPDVDMAVRALAAAGHVPAIEETGLELFCEELREVVAPLYSPSTGIRVASEFGWITATLAQCLP